MRLLIAALVLASAATFAPSPARADEYNYQSLLVGLRSSGMGGADVAFADSVTGAYSNPAGLASSGAQLVSISLSAYRVDLSGFAQVEAKPEGAGKVAGFQFTSFPLSFGLTSRLGSGLLLNHTLAFNFFVEDNNIGGSRIDVRIPSVADLFLRVRRSDQQSIEFGTAWGAEGSVLSVGAGVAYQLRTETVLADSLINIRDSVTYRLKDTQALHGAVLGRAGIILPLRLGNGREIRLGLSVTTPGAKVHSSAVVSGVELRTGTEGVLEPGAEAPMTYHTPWKFRFGAGYQQEGLRIAADLTLYSPIARYDVIPGVLQAEGLTTVNWNVGAEFALTQTLIMRVGTFSNLAASPAPPDDSAPQPQNFDDPSRLPHVNYYGATMGATLLSGRSSLDVSLIYQYGEGKVPADTARGYDPARGHVVVFMLGGSYNFDEGV